jgi:hypothetical protein
LKNPLRKICTAGSVRGETRSGLLYSEVRYEKTRHIEM